MKGLVILSGGLDSTTVLYKAKKECDEIEAISFNYGQQHKKELEFAKFNCKKLNIKHKIVDISNIQDFLKSSLTTDEEIPKGHYEEETMKSTVVPNRNMIFISIASGYALSNKIDRIYLGVHAGDHAIYPDCRPEFINLVEASVNSGNYNKIKIVTPYINSSKIDIVADGLKMNVPYGMTWTCYEGKEKACGKCGSCVERLEAFEKNSVKDPLQYEE